MDNVVKEFLNENKKEIFCFLKESNPFFPSCCADASLLLKKFIKEYFEEDFDVVFANKKLYQNRKRYHMWLEKDMEILDFTFFQFYIGVNKFKKVTSDIAYQYCIEEIQRGDIFFKKEYYDKVFEEQTVLSEEKVNKFLGNYPQELWNVKVDKNIPANDSLKQYLKECIPLLY